MPDEPDPHAEDQLDVQNDDAQVIADADELDLSLARALVAEDSRDQGAETAYEHINPAQQAHYLRLARAARSHWGHQIHHVAPMDAVVDAAEIEGLVRLEDAIATLSATPLMDEDERLAEVCMGPRDDVRGAPSLITLRVVHEERDEPWLAWTARRHREVGGDEHWAMSRWREAISRAQALGVTAVPWQQMDGTEDVAFCHHWIRESTGAPVRFAVSEQEHLEHSESAFLPMRARIAHRLMAEARAAINQTGGQIAYVNLPFPLHIDLVASPLDEAPPQEWSQALVEERYEADETPAPPAQAWPPEIAPAYLAEAKPEESVQEDPDEIEEAPRNPFEIIRRFDVAPDTWLINNEWRTLPNDFEQLGTLLRAAREEASVLVALREFLLREKLDEQLAAARRPKADPHDVEVLTERLADTSRWPAWMQVALWGENAREVVQVVLDELAAAVYDQDPGDDWKKDA